MHRTAAARQHYRKIEWNPADMTSPTQITSGTVQQAQQDARSTDSQETRNKPEPRTGNKTDHPGLYPSKRPVWTKSLKTDGKKQAAAGMGTRPADEARLAESTGLPQAEQHIAKPGEPPLHIRELLGKPEQETYTKLWQQLQDVPPHWRTKAVESGERKLAMDNIETRGNFDQICLEKLKSQLEAGNSPQARLAAAPLLKSLAQSQASLQTIWGALQTNRAVFGAPQAKL